MKPSAAEAASPASFQPLKAQTITGERSAGRLCPDHVGHPFHGTGIAAHRTKLVRSPAQYGCVTTAVDKRRTIAELRAGGDVDGRVRLHAQGPPHRPQRDPLPGCRAARPHGRDPRARVPRRRLPRRPVRARRPRASGGARGALPGRAPGGAERDPRRRAGSGRPRRLPARGLPRHGGARRLPRAPRARGLRRRLPPAAGRLPRRRGVPRGAPARPVHARRPSRLPRRAARAHGRGRHARPGGVRAPPAAQLGPADQPPRSSTTSARRASSSSARRSRSATPGALVGHLSLGQQLVAERAARLDASPPTSCSRSRTACWPTTAPTPSRAGASGRPRRSRSTA